MGGNRNRGCLFWRVENGKGCEVEMGRAGYATLVVAGSIHGGLGVGREDEKEWDGMLGEWRQFRRVTEERREREIGWR